MQLTSHLNNFERKIEELAIHRFPYTNTIGISRSLLALGTLLTLLINPINFLLTKTAEGKYLNPLLNPVIPINKYNFFLLFGFENAPIMKYVAILILLVVISGYYQKFTSILHWWVCISFLLFSSAIDGGDQIASILTLYLIPVCLTDPRSNHWNFHQPERSPLNIIGIFAIWIIRLQVAVIYFHAATGKFSVPEWANGSAIYYWLNHSVFGMPNWLEPITNSILSNIFWVTLLTYGVILLELSLFLGLTASNNYRKRILLLGIFFHFLIILYHGIFSFFFSITAGLILFLYPTYERFKLYGSQTKQNNLLS